MRGTWIASGLAVLQLVACSDTGDGEGPQGGSDVAAADVQTADATDDAAPWVDTPMADAPAVEDTPAPLDVEDPDTAACACLPGTFCEPTSGACLDCLVDEHCTYPSWCKGGQCVQTACFPNQKACDGLTPKQCASDGSKWVEGAPCPADGACVVGDCKEKVCEPGQKQCSKLQIQVCDEWGTGYAHVPCPPGSACYTDQCEPIKHNVVLIFDTSGSMGSLGALDAVPCICPTGCKAQPYPACEDLKCPQSRLGLAKMVFNQIFTSEVFQRVYFAMLRFPQREKADSPETCGSLFDPTGIGHYTNMSSAGGGNSDWISGDDNSHIVADGGWFDQYLHEILSVPFPVDEDDDTKPKALEWVDGNEVFEKIGPACAKNVDCPVGVCAIDKQSGAGECATHTNHELRATGSTPLGKSLFYAGEFLRKYGTPAGKPCESRADCGNVNYYCGPDGKCFDPLRGCRQNVVILFTDGVESPATETSNFFNPMVQAKRLRYGLGCAFDSDCGTGAKCKSGTCQEYGAPSPIMLIDGVGANRLKDYEGNPLTAIIHVVDISQGSSDSANAAIAKHGGGIFFPVTNGDPQALLDSINSILDVKANISQCIPQFPEGWTEEL